MKKINKLQNSKGFTLIEVVASIIILSIVLLSFSMVFIQTNKTAAYNNEKLVTVNLADAILAKIKSKTYTGIPEDKLEYYFTHSALTKDNALNLPLEIEMNEKIYTISYLPSQSTTKLTSYSEKDLNLVKVVVTVTAPDGKTKGSSEGYVTIE